MFTETNTPTEICAAVEKTARKRAATRNQKPTAAEQRAPIANETAKGCPQPKTTVPLVGNPIPRAASTAPQPTALEPHDEFHPYDPAPVAATIAEIVDLHRMRQGVIKAQTRLVLQAMAAIRFATHQAGDWDDDDAKAKARKRADDLYRAVATDPAHELYIYVMPYLLAMAPLDAQRAVYEKAMVRAVKRLPVYPFVKSVNGFGDVSFATIVGECGDIGSYKSVSAVWKRLGLAVIDGKRQGAPGDGATKDDWIRHGYSKQRRSVSWNARNQIIGGMGLWRPAYGDDLSGATYYQRVFAERARYESGKLGLPIAESAKGKESYKKHATNRAMRYTEKRLLRELYKAWRRS